MNAMRLGGSVLLLAVTAACHDGHGGFGDGPGYELLTAPYDVLRPDGQHAQGERVVRYNRISGETWLNDTANALRRIEDSEAIPASRYQVTLTVTSNGHVLVDRLDRKSGAAWYMDSENIWRRYTQPK